MRTKLLKQCRDNISSINMYLMHGFFVGYQFLNDNSIILDENPNALTSVLYPNNIYKNRFRYRAHLVPQVYSDYQGFMLRSSYIFIYSVLEQYMEDLHKLTISTTGKSHEKQGDETYLESIARVLDIQTRNILNTQEIYTLDYIRLRRNAVIHSEGELSRSLKDIIRNKSNSMNKYWSEQGIDMSLLDFSSKNIILFREGELIQIIRLLRDLVSKIDTSVLNTIGTERFVLFVLQEFRSEFSRDIKMGTSREKLERKFATWIKMQYDIPKEKIDFTKITFSET